MGKRLIPVALLALSGCAVLDHPPKRPWILAGSVIAVGIVAAASDGDESALPPSQRPGYKDQGQPDGRCCPLTPVN